MSIPRTQFFDENNKEIFPILHLKTINGQSIFAEGYDKEDIRIIEYAYASISSGLNDENQHLYVYKIDDEPQWLPHLYEIKDNDANIYPYLWIRTCIGYNTFVYKPWDGKNSNIMTIDLTNDFDQLFVNNKNVVEVEQTVKTSAQLYIGNKQLPIKSYNILSSIQNDKIQISDNLINDNMLLELKITFKKGFKITNDIKKISFTINIIREASDEFSESFGLEKSVNFSVIKIIGNVDNDLIVEPSSIKYSVNKQTGQNNLDTKKIKIGIRQREAITENNEKILWELPLDMSLGYKMDNDTNVKFFNLDSNRKIDDLFPINGKMPTSLLHLFLYNSAEVDDVDAYIDYASVDCLYDGELPIIYQLITNIGYIFIDDNGIISNDNIEFIINKSIGNNTISYSNYNTEISTLQISISFTDTNKNETTTKNLSFSNNDKLTINIKKLFDAQLNNFENNGYIEIHITQTAGNIKTRIANKRLYFIKNGQQFNNYIVDFSNDAEQIRVKYDDNDEKYLTTKAITYNIKPKLIKDDKININITDVSLLGENEFISISLNKNNNYVTDFIINIKEGLIFDTLDLSKKITFNIVGEDNTLPDKKVTKIKTFTLYPTTSLNLYSLLVDPSYLKIDKDGEVYNNNFNIHVLKNSDDKISELNSIDNIESENLAIYKSYKGINDAGQQLNTMSNVSFKISNQDDISDDTNLCFILKRNGRTVDFVNIETTYDPQQGEPGESIRGAIIYPAGEWNGITTYEKSDTAAPYVSIYNDDINETEYYILVKNGKSVNENPLSTGDDIWEKMPSFEAIYTDMIISKYGNIGGAIFYDDIKGNHFMYSSNGVDNNAQISSAYTYFLHDKDGDDKYVDKRDDYEDNVLSCIKKYSKFVPNILINFTSGEAWFGCGANIINKNGIFDLYGKLNIYNKSGENVATIDGTKSYSKSAQDLETKEDISVYAIQMLGKNKHKLYRYHRKNPDWWPVDLFHEFVFLKVNVADYDEVDADGNYIKEYINEAYILENGIYKIDTVQTTYQTIDKYNFDEVYGKNTEERVYVNNALLVNKSGKEAVYLWDGTSEIVDLEPETIIYEDGEIKTNRIYANDGYFAGEINSGGRFNGTLYANGEIHNAIVKNTDITINNGNMFKSGNNVFFEPDRDIFINDDQSICKLSHLNYKNKNNNGYTVKDTKSLGYISLSGTGEVKIPNITVNLSQYSNRNKVGNTPKMNPDTHVFVTIIGALDDEDNLHTLTYDMTLNEDESTDSGKKKLTSGYKRTMQRTYSLHAKEDTDNGITISVPENEKYSLLVLSENSNKINFKNCNLYIMINYSTYLKDRQGADYDSFNISAYGSDSIIYTSTQAIHNDGIPKFFASNNGFILQAGNGNRLVIDSSGIHIFKLGADGYELKSTLDK